MNKSLKARLNKVNSHLGSKEFLASSGLGNELAFYVFDYSPEYELDILEFISHSLDYLAKKNISVSHVNLFAIVIDYLGKRDLLDRALSTQREKGNAAIVKALRGPLNEEKLAKVVVERADPANHTKEIPAPHYCLHKS